MFNFTAARHHGNSLFPGLLPVTALIFGLISASPQHGAAQCTLVITDPPVVCGIGSANLTDPGVTYGSTAGMTFTYWKDAAATVPLSGPATVSSSGIYYIKGATAGGCSVIKPVTVTIRDLPSASIFYPGSPFCTLDPVVFPTVVGTNKGTFSAVGISTTSTGKITTNYLMHLVIFVKIYAESRFPVL